MSKPTMTKAELKVRIQEEAKSMKAGGATLSLTECKREAEKIFRQEFIIIS